MGKEITKIVLKALIDVRIRVDGEKQNFVAGDLIEVDYRNMKFYLMNGFGYESDEIIKVEKKGSKKTSKKETTEIENEDEIEDRKEEQADIAKEEAKQEIENSNDGEVK